MTCSVMKRIAVAGTWPLKRTRHTPGCFRHHQAPFTAIFIFHLTPFFSSFAVYFSTTSSRRVYKVGNGVVHSAPTFRKKMWLLCRLVNREKCTWCLGWCMTTCALLLLIFLLFAHFHFTGLSAILRFLTTRNDSCRVTTLCEIFQKILFSLAGLTFSLKHTTVT